METRLRWDWNYERLVRWSDVRRRKGIEEVYLDREKGFVSAISRGLTSRYTNRRNAYKFLLWCIAHRREREENIVDYSVPK